MLSIQHLFVFKVIRLFSSFIVTQEIVQTNIVDYCTLIIVVIHNFYPCFVYHCFCFDASTLYVATSNTCMIRGGYAL